MIEDGVLLADFPEPTGRGVGRGCGARSEPPRRGPSRGVVCSSGAWDLDAEGFLVEETRLGVSEELEVSKRMVETTEQCTIICRALNASIVKSTLGGAFFPLQYDGCGSPATRWRGML